MIIRRTDMSLLATFVTLTLLSMNLAEAMRPGNTCLQSTPCICRNDGLLKSETTVDCRSKHLNGIPSFEKIGAARKVNLGNNVIAKVAANAFRGITTPQVDLSYNMISSLHKRAFEGLETSLRVLILTRNKFSAIPTGSLKRLSNLKSLNLDNNLNLQVVNASAFKGLSKLETLSLKECSITTLHENSFAGLDNLRELSLYQNHIKEISPAVFLPLTSLHDLDLGHNGLDDVPPRAFKNIKSLSLSMNNFSSEASFDPAAFEYLSGSLERLKLSDCLMTVIPNRAIRVLSSLKHLEMNNNQLRVIKSEDLSGLSSLVHLMLDKNKNIQFTQHAFSRVANTLNYLSMRTMDMEKLPLKPLQGLVALEKLDISSNMFDSFGDGAFEGLCAKQYEISRSAVHWISKQAFRNTPNNLNLNLQGNVIGDTQFLELPCKFAEVEVDVTCNCELYNLLKTRKLRLTGKCRRPRDFEGLSINSEELKTVNRNTCDPNATDFQSVEAEVCPTFQPSDKGELSPRRCLSVWPEGSHVPSHSAHSPRLSALILLSGVFSSFILIVNFKL